MESIKDKVAIVGMGCTKFGELWDKSVADLIVDSCTEAFEDAGIEPKDVDMAWFATRESALTGYQLARALKLEYKPVTRLENFCAGGQDAIRNACFAVAARVCDIALACGVEKTRDHRGGFGFLIQERLDRGFQLVDLPPSNQFAEYATRYFHHYGLSYEEGKRILAHIAVKNHHNGMLAPKAHLHREITVEEVLKSRIISWPLSLYDACGMSDGGAAAIITTPEIAKNLKKNNQYILVKGLGLAVGADQSRLQTEFDFVHIAETVAAAKMAYEQAGVTNPRQEIDVANVHDCFTITELLIYEDLGFSPRGGAPEDVKAGSFTLEGDLPVNTDGGLKCFGHPLSASGIRMTYEIYNQLLGRAGKRQIKNSRLGLVHNIGGCVGIHIGAVSIFGRVD